MILLPTRAGYLYHIRFNTFDMAGIGQIGVLYTLNAILNMGIAMCVWRVFSSHGRGSWAKYIVQSTHRARGYSITSVCPLQL